MILKTLKKFKKFWKTEKFIRSFEQIKIKIKILFHCISWFNRVAIDWF